MRVIALVLTIISFMSFSMCWAEDTSLKKAYSLYYKGEKKAAISLMKDYVSDHPDPAAFYFLGYAYYEMQDMETASKYFNESFVRRPFYSPMAGKNN